MKTFSIQHALFPLLLLLSGSSYWFLQVRSTTLQTFKEQQPQGYYILHKEHNNIAFIRTIDSEKTEDKEGGARENREKKDFQEDKNLLPDVQLLKFILDKSKEGLPVLRLPAFLYR